MQVSRTEKGGVALNGINVDQSISPEVLEEIKVLREDVKRKVGEGLNGLSAAAGRISAEVINELDSFQNQVVTHQRLVRVSWLTD